MRKREIKADQAVKRYRRYNMFSLVILILLQAYWLFGNELRVNLQKIFDAR